MKIVIKMTDQEMDEILSVKSNRCHKQCDIEINVIDAIDAHLDLPGYDVEIEIEG